MTRQRKLVLDAIHTIHHPATASEIFTTICKFEPHVELTTIYRTLSFLEGFGLITAYGTGNGCRRYKHTPHGSMPHLVCRSCGKTLEIADADLKTALVKAIQSAGYDEASSSIIISSVCPFCAQKHGLE